MVQAAEGDGSRLRLGERIHVFRRRAGYSLAGLADAVGIDASSLSRYEHGLRMPPADVLADLADALGVTPNDLLGYAGRPAAAASADRVTLDQLGRVEAPAGAAA